MTQLFNRLANLFPLWVLTCSGLALFYPHWFTWFSGRMIVWGLAVIMIGMGITLSVDDFRRVARMPKQVMIGVAAQFIIMPFLGWSCLLSRRHGVQCGELYRARRCGAVGADDHVFHLRGGGDDAIAH
jgi:predicted Na+-dependent transporter